MGKFGLTYTSNEFDVREKPTLTGMLEPALRTTVFVAQVQAGLWRRNRDSLNSQLFAYHGASFRRQILDQDVTMLQWVAALYPDPNQFLVNFIFKFQLVRWAAWDFVCSDDSIRQMTSLVEEFLGTLSVIIGERYTPGVGQVRGAASRSLCPKKPERMDY